MPGQSLLTITHDPDTQELLFARALSLRFDKLFLCTPKGLAVIADNESHDRMKDGRVGVYHYQSLIAASQGTLHCCNANVFYSC